MLRMKICAMKNAMLFFVGLVAGIAAANEPHAKGRLTLSFKESDPVGDFAEMKRRVPSSFDDKDDAGKDKPYNVSERTYSVEVPESYDKGKPAPLFVWISATDGGGMQGQLRESLAKRGFIYAGANGTGNEIWPPIRFRAAIDAVFNLKKLYNIDPKQIFIAGNSGGGRCASMVSITYPDVFTGGGFYVIGCDFWDNLPAEKPGHRYPGFLPKRDKKLFDVAKKHYYVFLTGSKDFNRDGTIKAYYGYGKDGFRNCFYNETEDLGHATPPAADIEKAFAFLDRSLHADAFAACEQAAKAVKAKRYADAAKKLGPFRGTCAAVDDKWGELVALADSETEKITSNAALKPKLRKLKLQGIVSKFGPVLGEKAKKALAEQAE